MTNIAFLGLGIMGYPMAGHLIKKGYNVVAYNRTVSTLDKWHSEFGGKTASTPREASADADYVISCVSADKDVEEISSGEFGAFNSMKRGSIFIDHSTISPSLTKSLSEAARPHGIGFVDAPVSGGDKAAKSGKLTVMAGASIDDWLKSKPVISSYASELFHVGPVGSGQSIKMINQIIVAGIMQATAEGLRLMEETGLQKDLAIEVLMNGSAYSRILEHRTEAMINRDFTPGFTTELMLKDLDIGLREAKALGLDLPVTNKVMKLLKTLQNTEFRHSDITSVIANI